MVLTSEEFLTAISPKKRFNLLPLTDHTARLPHVSFYQRHGENLDKFDVRSAEFWIHVETYLDRLTETKRFKRLWDIYVSPAAAASVEAEDEIGLVEGRISRAEHCIDVALIALEDVRHRIKVLGENISPEEVMLRVRNALFHDLATFAQSHITEDSLREQGLTWVDHDIILQYALSDSEILEVDRVFGVDSKRANVALLPVDLHLVSEEVRFRAVEEIAKHLEKLYCEDPNLARVLNAPPLNTIVDFSIGSIDQILFGDPVLIRISRYVHDLYDLAYSRTDSSQQKKTELKALRFLKSGRLRTDLHVLQKKDVNFDDLPDHISESLSGNGILPSGVLSYLLVKDKHGSHLLLIESKKGEDIIRAYNGPFKSNEISRRAIQGLERVKTPKACSRFREFLRGISPGEAGEFIVDNIKALISVLASLGDDQSRKIGSLKGIVNAGILVRMNLDAKMPILIQLFGTRKDIEARLIEMDRNDLKNGLNNSYSTVLFLKPNSNYSGGPDWNSKEGPDKAKLEELFKEFKALAEKYESRIRKETGVQDFRFMAIGAPPVKKRFKLKFTVNGLKEFKERIVSRDDAIYPHGDHVYLSRSCRSVDDIFSLGFEIGIEPLKTRHRRYDLAKRVNENTDVSIVETMHRGIAFVLRRRDRAIFRSYQKEFREEVNKILDETDLDEDKSCDLVEDESRGYHPPIQSDDIIKPARSFFSYKWNTQY